MEVITEMYYYCFNKARTGNSLSWFHLSGALAFCSSAKKHYKRGNTRMAMKQIPLIIWQLKEAGTWMISKTRS